MTQSSATVLARSSRDAPEGTGAPRREIKFALPAADLGKLTSILRTNFREVRHGHEPGSAASVVRSIYFDDERLGAYHESVEGTGRRRKLRLRWYNDDEQALFFEVKSRSFDLVAKKRLPVDASVPVTSLDYRALVGELADLLDAPERELLERHKNPVLIAEYRRDYYEGQSVRVTVDTNLQWFDQTGALRPRTRFGVSLPHLIVLEVKLPASRSLAIAPLLRPLRLTPTRSSKYVIGCERLGILGA